ncbi:Na/Pi cotransporter family protein [Alkalilacustris brevis]|uniref:Na/Pi cotransporter family protein n=1 Tax=Alkalilacustris brevis TaxID=2026338 RepID=UPI0012D2B53B|nr:Na/Pi symporter [Alkalilacustris brevis]
MTGNFLVLLGGIGLFLFGMHTMTEGLRTLASTQARQVLGRFTHRPLSGAVTGALATAAVQSSSATMVTTVGFVGAGLLSFSQALGILYGASIGTTITGWMVLLLGFKLQLTTAALPLLFLSALVRVLARGRVARIAATLAGLSLVFLGIDMMQDGMAAYEDRLTPDSFPPPTLTGRLQLLGIGVIVTLVTQSSSAGVVGTLVLLGTGAVSFEQAAAMVIGMHIGTSFTAMLAAVGGSLAVRQTALANVIYHVATGLVALALIDLGAAVLLHRVAGGDAQIVLVAFHTGFNLAGAAVMLPLTRQFAGLVEWMVPAPVVPRPSDRLDPRLLSDPGAAMDAAAAVARESAERLFITLAEALGPGSDPAPLAHTREITAETLDALQDYLSRITIEDGQEGRLIRFDALLHLLDHLRRLLYRAGQGARLRTAARDPKLHRQVKLMRGLLIRFAEAQPAAAAAAAAASADTPTEQPEGPTPERRPLAQRLARLEGRLGLLEARMRHVMLRRPPHVVGMTAAELFLLTDALRWMRRTARHAERIVHYQSLAVDAVTHEDLGDEATLPPSENETTPDLASRVE